MKNLCKLIIIFILFSTSCYPLFAKTAKVQIEESVQRLWQRRGSLSDKLIVAMQKGQLPLPGLDSQEHLMAELPQFVNSGLVGFEDMLKIEEAVFTNGKSVDSALEILSQCAIEPLARDEIVLRVIAIKATQSADDIASLWQALSPMTKKLGGCNIQELLLFVYQKRVGQLAATDITVAFPKQSFFRDGLLLREMTLNDRWQERDYGALISPDIRLLITRRSPLEIFQAVASKAITVPGGGRALVHRLRAGLYELLVTNQQEALQMLAIWSTLGHVQLGQAEHELFGKYIQPEALNISDNTLVSHIEWLVENVPPNVPRNAYLFSLAAIFAKKPEHIVAIAKVMQLRLDDDSIAALELVVFEGARLAAKENAQDQLGAALEFVQKALPAQSTGNDAAKYAAQLPLLRIRDAVVIEVMNKYSYSPEDVARAIPYLNTAGGRAEAGGLGYDLAEYSLADDLDTRLAAVLQFFPKPSRRRDEYLAKLIDRYARDGQDVAKIRKYQYSHLSDEQRQTGPYGQTVAAISEIAQKIAQGSTPMEKAHALVAYIGTLMANGGMPEDEIPFVHNVFSFDEDISPLDRKELVRYLLIGEQGILANREAEVLIMDRLFDSQISLDGSQLNLPQQQELLRQLMHGYIFRLSEKRKVRVYLSLMDMVGCELEPAEMVRMLIEKLGVVPIKFAQMLASRDDILTPKFKQAFEALCDDVASFDRGTAIEVIETETGTSIRKIADEGLGKQIGAGSVKQVYRITHNGQPAVVKIIRPGARSEVDEDLKILFALAGDVADNPMVKRIIRQPEVMLQQFERELRAEIDSQNEANNVKHFRQIFANDPELTAPKVLLLEGDVMVEQFIKGKKITKASESYGLDPKELSKRVVRGMMVQIFRDGFFHGDPHPGNVMVTSDGTIVFIDWGMTGRLPLEQRFNLVKLCTGIFFKRPKMVLKQLYNMDDDGSVNLSERAHNGALQDIENILQEDVQAGEKMLRLLYVGNQAGIDIPPDFTMMAKAIGCIEGTAKQLDPDVNVAPAIAKAFLQAYVGKVKEVLLKPFKWLRDRFSRETIQHMRSLAEDEELQDLAFAN